MNDLLDADKCPSCGTEAIYKIAENSFGCKCTYEFETDVEQIKERNGNTSKAWPSTHKDRCTA